MPRAPQPRPRPLFIMGNKRSGSTLMTDLLNVHPEVFISHESDIAWLLYQARGGRPERYEPHPLDSTLMLSSTVRSCRQILRSTLSGAPGRDDVVETFYRVQMHLMKKYLHPSAGQRLKRIIKVVGKRPTPGRLWRALRQKPELLHKESLAWIGDKKHAQHLDPAVQSFLHDHFPDARYIHVIRHPRSVVASTMEAARKWGEMPEYFKGSAEQILEQWAIHEEWALRAKEKTSSPILTIRLEDLWSAPSDTLARVLSFLGLEMTDAFVDLTSRMVYPRDPNQKYASLLLPEVPRATRIMKIYGYGSTA